MRDRSQNSLMRLGRLAWNWNLEDWISLAGDLLVNATISLWTKKQFRMIDPSRRDQVAHRRLVGRVVWNAVVQFRYNASKHALVAPLIMLLCPCFSFATILSLRTRLVDGVCYATCFRLPGLGCRPLLWETNCSHSFEHSVSHREDKAILAPYEVLPITQIRLIKMRLRTLVTIVASLTGLAAAQSQPQPSSWASWSPSSSASVPVTTTITKTLLHVNNQTVTSTSYSASSTGHFSAPANLTSVKPTAISTTSAPAIATYSAGAAPIQELNLAIAAVAGLGAVVYGLY